MEKTIQELLPLLSAYGLKVIGAIVILLVGRFAARLCQKAARRLMDRGEIDQTVSSFAANLVYFAVLAFAVVAALAKFGVETTSFVAVLGAAGFAVGMALQGSLGNFAAGVLLLIFRPFKVGDYIDAGGTSGTVKEIQLFATILNTPDNVQIIVPNGTISSGVIKNFSAYDTRRVDLLIGIGYGASIPKAMELLHGILKAESRVLSDPESMVAVGELGDSSVNIIVRAWVKREDYWGTKFDLTHAIKEALDENGIDIPYPQQVVHMHQADA